MSVFFFTSKLLSTYKSRGYIEPVDADGEKRWRKTEAYLRKHPQRREVA